MHSFDIILSTSLFYVTFLVVHRFEYIWLLFWIGGYTLTFFVFMLFCGRHWTWTSLNQMTYVFFDVFKFQIFRTVESCKSIFIVHNCFLRSCCWAIGFSYGIASCHRKTDQEQYGSGTCRMSDENKSVWNPFETFWFAFYMCFWGWHLLSWWLAFGL